MKEPQPRSANFLGMRTDPHRMNLGTWLEPEELTYPSGSMVRRARAINIDTGKLKVVRCGIPDTFFSIPVRGGGYLTISDGQILKFHPPIKKNDEGDVKNEQ